MSYLPSEVMSTVLGAFMPPVIDIVNEFVQDEKWRYVISFILSLLVGVLSVVITGEWSVGDIVGSIASAIMASQAVYQLYWKGTKSHQNAVTMRSINKL